MARSARFTIRTMVLALATAASGCSSQGGTPEILVAGEKHSATGQALAGIWVNGVWNGLPARAPWDDAAARGVVVDGADVYAAGNSSEMVDSVQVDHPGFWRNGIRVELPTLGGADALVTSIVAVGGVVRVGGALRDPVTGLLLPGVWTDGPEGSISMAPGTGTFRFAPLSLPADASGGEVNSVRVLDGALVVSGSLFRTPSPGADVARFPALWRDGVRVDFPLAPGALSGLAVDACSDRGVTYVTGNQFLGPQLPVPGYWRDGTWVELPRVAANLAGLAGHCIARSGQLTVVGGRSEMVGPVVVGTGGYWRGGTWSSFSDPSHLDITAALDLVEVGTDLLVSGAKFAGGNLTESVAGYWLGPEWVAMPLAAGEYQGIGWAIAVRWR